MKKTTKHALLPGALAAGIALAAIQARSDELGIDWGRKEGVDVPSGQSATQTDAIRVSDGGAFVKSGDGTLTLPLGKLDSVADVSVEALAGRLEIEPGAPQGGEVAAPSFIADKAAFWVDADATSSLVLNGSVVTRWCDCRETDTASPTLYNARPATANNAGTAEIDQTLVETNGHNAVFFGGLNSNNKRFMQFYKGLHRQRSLKSAMPSWSLAHTTATTARSATRRTPTTGSPGPLLRTWHPQRPRNTSTSATWRLLQARRRRATTSTASVSTRGQRK